MMIRKIIGKYIIGKGIVPFLINLEKLLNRLRKFMFNQQMNIYYHYKDRQDTEFLNHIRLQNNLGKE